MDLTIPTSDNLFCSNSSPILELSVKFASQICHENINKLLDGTYLADFGIDITFREFFEILMGLPIFVFGLKWTTVHVCSISDGKCQVATDEKFVGANGITVNRDRSLIFVNDPSEKLVTVLRRGDNFQLVKESVIKLPIAADNIEFDDEAGEILIGTIPDVHAAVKHMGGDKAIG